ncbi:MAG: hypothetical protein LKJ48_11295 [Lactobacillus sp.]|jgi:hypothetical protein|nr:hypothetical protein [Lactobacillus sp.]
MAILFCLGLLIAVLLLQWLSPSEYSQINSDRTFWKLSNGIRNTLVITMVIEFPCVWLIRIERYERYLAIVAYVVNLVLIPAFFLTVFALALDDPLQALKSGSFTVLIGLLIMLTYHTILVFIAVKKHKLIIRDKYVNVMVNIFSVIMIFSLAFGRYYLNEFPEILWHGMCFFIGMLYSLYLLQLPRVTHYWHKRKNIIAKPTLDENKERTQQVENSIKRQVRWRKK